MANCKYTFDGKKWYSYDEFRSYLLENIDSLGLEKGKLTGKLRPLQTVEQFQKPKTSDFNNFREKQLGRNITEEQSHLDQIEEALQDSEYSAEQKQQLQKAKDLILDRIKQDRLKYQNATDITNELHSIVDAEDLKDFTLDDLIRAYNGATDEEGYVDYNLQEKAKLRIGHYLNELGKERLSKHDKFIESEANKTDLSWRELWFKALSHINQKFPGLQEFSKVFDDAYLSMQQQRNTEKAKLEKLGKAVVREANKKLGLTEKIGSLFSHNSAKYFEYLDNGKGQYITDTKGLSKAQIDFLDYMRELTKDKITLDSNEHVIEDAVLQTDKGFAEAFKSEGILKAMSLYMGGANNLDVEVVNPINNQKQTYSEAQKAILEANKNGKISKPTALAQLLKIAYKAKKQGENTNYSLDYSGKLTSKFDQPRNKDAGYSKDFYSAAMKYIDDITHVEHMNKIVPIVNSLEYLYEKGFDSKFPNVQKFLTEWKNEQVYQKNKVTDPTIDAILKFFRTFTSQIVMGFNYPASVINVAIGQYNNWRAEGSKLWLVGNKRLFGKDGLNKYSIDLIKKYNIVDSDYDSNPKLFAGRLFDMLAYGAQRFGEFQIQGSMWLGQLTPKEFDSFEYNKEGELVAKKGTDEKELAKKFVTYKNRVSDIQGKYAAKDRRNFMRFEAGKNASQFKLWVFDWWKERFGEKYIDANNKTHTGSWRTFTNQSFADLRQMVKTKEFWTSKEMQQNLRGAMTVALLLVLTHRDDEDKKRKREALSLDGALGQLLFLLDPSQAKYMLTSPVASIGTVTKFIDAFEDMMKGDSKKLKKDAKKIVPYNKALNLIPDDKKK